MNTQTSKVSGSRAGEEASIRILYQQMMEGWNKGSGNDFAAPFTDDSDFVGFDGTYLKGCQEIASFHQELFDRFVKGSRLVGKIRSIRFLSPDIVIMIAVGGTVMAGQSDIEPERNSIHTLVAVKRDSKWQFTAFQNSRAQFIGRPEQSQALTEELRQQLSRDQ
jgi:uncharacterized protein (TIGR02246 family)